MEAGFQNVRLLMFDVSTHVCQGHCVPPGLECPAPLHRFGTLAAGWGGPHPRLAGSTQVALRCFQLCSDVGVEL